MIGINGILVCAIGTLIFYILAVIVYGVKSTKKKTEPEHIPLADIANELWLKGQETGKIELKDLAPLWRKSMISEKERSDYAFKTTQVEEFFTFMINQPWFDQADAHKEICYQLLRMLEEEGDCPSVVNPSNDVEASWDSNTYNMLGRTTLLDHTLHVAKNTVDLMMEAESHHVIPDAMIAALAHDIGKLPSNRTHLYSLGEHPLAAGRILAAIKPFKGINRKTDITKAIKEHHMKAIGLIGKTLKKADQIARQQELETAVDLEPIEVVKAEPNPEQKQQKNLPKPLPDPPVPSSEKAPPLPPYSSGGSGSARQAEADIYGDESQGKSKRNEKPKTINISTWFDPQLFLVDLFPYINQIQGRRFTAFSMPNGIVYIQIKAIEEVIRKQSKDANAMDIATMGPKDKTMQKVVYTVVDQFRKHNVIATDLIKDQYFGGYFTINVKGGKSTMKGYYAPFKAEAFGSVAELESKRKGFLKNFTSVEPQK